jgi:glutathione S-transferase
MMKLYFSPGACSLSPHIALREAGLPFELAKVDLHKHVLDDGTDMTKINPKGYVPALQLDDGSVLTEGPAIVQYIADQAPASKLAPANGTLERYRLMEWLNYITSEVHKQFSPLFNPSANDQTKGFALAALEQRFNYLSETLWDRPYLLGEAFSVADAYLFTVLSWTKWVGIDLAQWPVLNAYVNRIAERPAVQQAMHAEGLLKARASQTEKGAQHAI